jgi:hypothetical protein
VAAAGRRRSGGGGGLRFGSVSSVKMAAASGRTDPAAAALDPAATVKMALGKSKSEGAQAARAGRRWRSS